MTDEQPGAGSADEQWLAVGRVRGPFGVRGEAYVETWTDAPDERFAPGSQLRTDPESVGPLIIDEARWHGDRLVASFRGIDERAAVLELRGTQLLIAAGSRPALTDPDEFYDSDLEGLRAVAVDGHDYGTVEEVVHVGSADYLLVRIDGAQHLVPFVSAIVIQVDIAGRRVVIDAPDGLFEL